MTPPPEVSHEAVACDVSDRILTITFDRPKVLNALTYPMLEAYLAALGWAEANPDVSAIIVTGSGSAFSAGTDLSARPDAFDAAPETGPSSREEPEPDFGGRIALQIHRSSKPILAAVNGAAMGFGSTMLLPMDLRFASEEAYFGFVFARRGLMPEACSTWFLPQVVGISRAMEWTMTGRHISAREAQAGGLIHDVLPAEQLLPHVRSVAESLIRNSSPTSLMATRRALWAMLSQSGPEEAHRLESKGMAYLKSLPDFREAVGAFRSKRPPSFAPSVPAKVRQTFEAWTRAGREVGRPKAE